MVASTLTAKGPCSPTNCFILGSSVLLPYIKKRNIYSKVIQKESTTYWKKTWPDWLWSISMTQICGTLFQVALSGQNCDLASRPWNSNRRQIKWWKTMTEMRTIANTVENVHVGPPLLGSNGPPPKTFPVKASQVVNSRKQPPLITGTFLAPQYIWPMVWNSDLPPPPGPCLP